MEMHEAQELALLAMGYSQEETNARLNRDDLYEYLDGLVYDKMGIGFESFWNVAERLLPLTPLMHTAITGEPNHVFLTKENGHWRSVCKLPSQWEKDQ